MESNGAPVVGLAYETPQHPAASPFPAQQTNLLHLASPLGLPLWSSAFLPRPSPQTRPPLYFISPDVVNDIELAQRGEVHLQRVRLQRGNRAGSGR